MKILFVHSRYANGNISGENIAVDLQIDALRLAGHEVAEFIVDTKVAEKESFYKVKSALRVITGLGTSPQEVLNSFRPDVVHVHNLFPNIGFSWVKDYRGPIVATVHNFRLFCAAGTLFRDGEECVKCPKGQKYCSIVHKCYKSSMVATLPLYLRSKFPLKDSYLSQPNVTPVFLSQRVLKTYEEFGFVNPRSVVIENFIPDDTLDLDKVKSSDEEHWVFVGRLSTEKGIVELVDNWPSGETLHIYGDGPLKSVLETKQTSNIVLMGVADRSSVRSIISRSQGLMLPSIWREGAVPLNVIESFSVGRPVVCLKDNACADLLQTEEAGVVLEDLSGLKNALLDVTAKRETYERKAFKTYQSRYTRNSWIEKIQLLYSEVTGA